jgi:hypothetical protein
VKKRGGKNGRQKFYDEMSWIEREQNKKVYIMKENQFEARPSMQRMLLGVRSPRSGA